MDGSSPGSSVHGILQARILEWAAMTSSGDLPDPWIEPWSPVSPHLAGGFFTASSTWEALSNKRLFLMTFSWFLLSLQIYFLGELRKPPGCSFVVFSWVNAFHVVNWE